MSIAITGSWWLAALLAAAPSPDGSRLEEYGGSFKCRDEVVKAQVVRALSSGGTPYQANAILNAGHPELDGKSLHAKIDKAASMVSKPGAAGSPSSMRVKRSGDGAAIDVLMCRYRRAAGKSWDKITTADLQLDGHLAKRMPAAVGMLGRAFALSEKSGASEDSVIVLVAAGVGGKTAELDVTVASKGLQKGKRRGDAPKKADAGARILKEASDPSWKQYEYGDEIVFPEAKDEVFGYENKAFDCSYYVWLVYKRAGIEYDFTGTEGLAQLDGGQFVKVTTPRAGDLVVWRPELGSGDIHHVGIIADDTSTFWDNSGSNSVGLSKLSWSVYDVPRIYLRRKGL
jgi:cell wall-associated NlpC family hydrolase